MANNRPQLQGSNITGVQGAQHGAQKNLQAMQRASQASYEFGTLGSAGTTAGGASAGLTSGAASGVQLAGNNITGVSGAQHGAQKNAQAMQRLGRKA